MPVTGKAYGFYSEGKPLIGLSVLIKRKGLRKMKVQKRDGRIVTYEVDKITNAIKKANVEVEPSQKASDELIKIGRASCRERV